MLHQLERRLAIDRFLAGKPERERRAVFSLLIPCIGNNICIDIAEKRRRLRTIKIGVPSCDQNDLAVPGQKIQRLRIQKQSQQPGELLFCYGLQRAVQWK